MAEELKVVPADQPSDDLTDEQRAIVQRYPIPNIQVLGHKNPNNVQVVLDRRFGATVKTEDLDQFLWFVANAMAVAAGFSSFGDHSVLINPYRTPGFIGDK